MEETMTFTSFSKSALCPQIPPKIDKKLELTAYVFYEKKCFLLQSLKIRMFTKGISNFVRPFTNDLQRLA